MGPEREIDSDSLRAILTPSGRLRRPTRMRFVELELSSSSGRAKANISVRDFTDTAYSISRISPQIGIITTLETTQTGAYYFQDNSGSIR